jgi:putative transposase
MPDSKSDGRSTRLPARKHPAHGVLIIESKPTIVFLTVCTKDRKRWLASAAVHEELRKAWHKADAWCVGRYVVMPDHIHLFTSPGKLEVSLDEWIQYWKSCFTREVRRAKLFRLPPHPWQTDHWDTRLRKWQLYEEKWKYVRNNPVRHGLVQRAEDWPYQGEIQSLRWE